ncbi:MAG TPA: hypothetical protein V6D46_06570 [Coleofasciculaceae cyanobacterium]
MSGLVGEEATATRNALVQSAIAINAFKQWSAPVLSLASRSPGDRPWNFQARPPQKSCNSWQNMSAYGNMSSFMKPFSGKAIALVSIPYPEKWQIWQPGFAAICQPMCL